MCRKQEFNFEGHRYFDLARTGRIGSVLNVEEFRGILPIPSNEIATGQGLGESCKLFTFLYVKIETVICKVTGLYYVSLRYG